MVSKQVEVINKTGIHARPASEFVMAAKKYSCKISIKKENAEPVNAKSMVRILAEGIGKGDMVELCADGEDEEAALTELVTLIENKFGDAE